MNRWKKTPTKYKSIQEEHRNLLPWAKTPICPQRQLPTSVSILSGELSSHDGFVNPSVPPTDPYQSLQFPWLIDFPPKTHLEHHSSQGNYNVRVTSRRTSYIYWAPEERQATAIHPLYQRCRSHSKNEWFTNLLSKELWSTVA